MKTNIVIIGGGIVGCSAAYFLAQKGHAVTLLEKEPAVGLSASGRCACGVRQQNRTGALELAMASVRLWATLSEALQYDLEYVRTGNLKIALDTETAEELEKQTTWEQDHGLNEVHMVTAKECHELVPGITGRVIAGKLCPTDGMANPMRVTRAFAAAAVRLGAVIRPQTPADKLLLQGSTVCGVATDTEEIEADVVLNTAGPWAQRFNEMAGCSTPIQPGLSQLIITERQPTRFSVFMSAADIAYILQPKSGNIIIGISGKPNETFSQRVDYEDITLKAKQMIEVLPWLGEVNFLRSFAGITEYTPDGEPYIGSIPGVTGFYTAAGFHGQGFCVGPKVGQIMAELIVGNEPDVSLAPFKPDRRTNLNKK
jgi:sarcosine oxidase subunit beta